MSNQADNSGAAFPHKDWRDWPYKVVANGAGSAFYNPETGEGVMAVSMGKFATGNGPHGNQPPWYGLSTSENAAEGTSRKVDVGGAVTWGASPGVGEPDEKLLVLDQNKVRVTLEHDGYHVAPLENGKATRPQRTKVKHGYLWMGKDDLPEVPPESAPRDDLYRYWYECGIQGLDTQRRNVAVVHSIGEGTFANGYTGWLRKHGLHARKGGRAGMTKT